MAQSKETYNKFLFGLISDSELDEKQKNRWVNVHVV